MIKVLTKSHISFKGEMIQPGTEFEFNPKEIDVDRLIELNAVEVIEVIEEEKKPSKKKVDQKADENPGE